MEIINILTNNDFTLSNNEKKLIIKNDVYLINVDDKIKNNNFNFKEHVKLLCVIGSLCYIHKKYNKMIYYYNIAINNGNVSAMNKLGHYYYDVKKNYSEAVKYFKMAIDKGNANAMHNLGYYYDDIEKDYVNAIKYYMMAIDKGNACAMNNLGLYYYHIEKDYVNAIKYYMMAIDKGNLDALNNLGIYYYNIEKDYVNAIKYYIMAINNGNSDAMNNLEKLFINNIDVYINYILLNNYEPTDDKLTFIKNHLIKDTLECCICYENFNYYIKTDCDHKYCYKCFLQLTSCAICRSAI